MRQPVAARPCQTLLSALPRDAPGKPRRRGGEALGGVRADGLQHGPGYEGLATFTEGREGFGSQAEAPWTAGLAETLLESKNSLKTC